MNKSDFFQAYYDKAKINCIILMEGDGSIIEVNQSFTNHFGYTDEDIKGKNFSILFTEHDRKINKPQHELDNVRKTGQANDENFVLHQNGQPIWCTGESILVASENKNYIVKDIVNLQTRKQMKLLLTDSEELLDTIFNSATEIPLMILDGGMRIHKVNNAFKKLFGLEHDIVEHAKLSELHHPFWDTQSLRNELRTLIVHKMPITDSLHPLQTSNGELKTISIKSKCIQRQGGTDTRFYIMLEEVMDAEA